MGWSEPAATNAPIVDELVAVVFRMNENPILPARIYIFFPPLLYPKIFPPPTYHLPTPPPLTPSPKLQIRRAGASLEQGSLEQGSGWSRSGTQVSILLFFLSFILFVCLWSCFVAQLHKIRYTLQRNIAKKATLRYSACFTAL